MSEIHEIFKVPVYGTKLTQDTKTISNYCLSLSKKSKGRFHSNSGGWQSDILNKIDRPLKSLCDNIMSHSSIFLTNLGFKGKLLLNTLWININGYRDFNLIHKHDHSFISGVYYVQTPKDCGNIQFLHPGLDVFEVEWNNRGQDYNRFNSTQWSFPAVSNSLYLFPSWLKHYVEPNVNKKEKRISISFNVNFK